MAAPQGFEPRYADPESAVLPLNEGAEVCGWTGLCAAALVDSMVLTNRGQPELAERSGLRFKGAFAPSSSTVLARALPVRKRSVAQPLGSLARSVRSAVVLEEKPVVQNVLPGPRIKQMTDKKDWQIPCHICNHPSHWRTVLPLRTKTGKPSTPRATPGRLERRRRRQGLIRGLRIAGHGRVFSGEERHPQPNLFLIVFNDSLKQCRRCSTLGGLSLQ